MVWDEEASGAGGAEKCLDVLASGMSSSDRSDEADGRAGFGERLREDGVVP